VEEGDELVVFRVFNDLLIDAVEQFDKIRGAVFDFSVHNASHRGHEQGCADAVPTDITKHNTAFLRVHVGQVDEIIVISACFVAIETLTGNVELSEVRGLLGQKALLDSPCEL